MSTRFGRILLQQGRRTVGVRNAPVVGRHVPMVSSSTHSSPLTGRVVVAGQDFGSMRWFSDKTTEEPKAEEAKAEGTAAAAEGEEKKEAEAPSTEQAAGPSKEEQLEAQVKELKDQVLRSLAEQDNTRRIAQRDVDSASQFAIKSFAKSLLDVSDNLTRAMEAVPEEMRHDKEKHAVLANLYEGIEMTDRGLIKAFESNGLVKYGKEGEPFDPNKHEALYNYDDPAKEDGTVGQVMKPGFMLRDRVLRPAEVGVIKKSS